MKKNEWVDKPFEERIAWYRNQVSKLKELLSTDSDHQKKSEEILKSLKMRMVFDNTPSDNQPGKKTEQAQLYHRTIFKAYKRLPNFDTRHTEWEQPLEQTSAILSEWPS